MNKMKTIEQLMALASEKDYKPLFDTEIRKTVKTVSHNTMHTNEIDWDYPFGDPAILATLCCSDEQKQGVLRRRISDVRICEQWETNNAMASTGAVYQRVVGIGMASCWPYWKPRPTILVSGTLGTEWIDWWHLNGAREG